MKPQFEHVAIPEGCSIRVLHRQVPEIPFEWHHHPELELTLTLNSRGLRFIGDHVGAYESGDLVLVPSEMPHTWASMGAADESSPHHNRGCVVCGGLGLASCRCVCGIFGATQTVETVLDRAELSSAGWSKDGVVSPRFAL